MPDASDNFANRPDDAPETDIDERLAAQVTTFLNRLHDGFAADINDFCRSSELPEQLLRPLLETALALEAARQQTEVASLAVTFASQSPGLERLGDFQLLREAGRGGMGIVYEAVEKSLQRRVAVKVLHQRTCQDDRAVRRFQREARTAARLHHTNIVPVLTVGEEQGTHYFAMPFIEGETLADVLARLRSSASDGSRPTLDVADLSSARLTVATHAVIDGSGGRVRETLQTVGTEQSSAVRSHAAVPLQRSKDRTENVTSVRQCRKTPAYVQRVAAIGLQVAEALDYAAQQGVLHRDIKPSNLLLASEGTVWVADFGLARMLEGDDLTLTGESLGTPRYMAPERCDGVHTERGDIYGLGVVLYELLTLQSPFDARDRSELLHQILHGVIRAPRSLDRTIPRDLETIVLKSIAREPADRYASAAELAMDLRLFGEDRPIRSRRVSLAESAWKWCRRNPGVAGLLASVAVLLIVIAVGSQLSARTLRGERDAANTFATRAVLAEGRAVAASSDARSAEARATEALRTADAARIAAEQADEVHRRDLYRSYLNEIRTAAASPGVGHRFRGLDAVRSALQIQPFSVMTKDEQRELRNAAVACLRHGDAAEVHRWSVRPFGPHSSDKAPNLPLLAVPDTDGQTFIQSLDDSMSSFALKMPDCPELLVSARWFSPCGRWMHEILAARTGRQPALRRVWDWRRQTCVLDVATTDFAWSFCFHPDGRHFVQIEDAVIRIYDLETGLVVRESAPRFLKGTLAISHDGRLLACLVSGYPPVILDAESLDLVAELSDLEHAARCVWSPVAEHLLIRLADGRIAQWDHSRRRSILLPQRQSTEQADLMLSPDERILAAEDALADIAL